MTGESIIIKYGYNDSHRGINPIIKFTKYIYSLVTREHTYTGTQSQGVKTTTFYKQTGSDCLGKTYNYTMPSTYNRKHRIFLDHSLYTFSNINTHTLIQDWTQTLKTVFQKISVFSGVYKVIQNILLKHASELANIIYE